MRREQQLIAAIPDDIAHQVSEGRGANGVIVLQAKLTDVYGVGMILRIRLLLLSAT